VLTCSSPALIKYIVVLAHRPSFPKFYTNCGKL
jgi:hypothetical protein